MRRVTVLRLPTCDLRLAGWRAGLTAQRALATVEDRWLPPARFDESTRVNRALGIGYRAGKWFALDLPQDHFLMVVGHEIFGHGSRLREIGARGVHYSFDAPIPYGPGGAATEFSGDLLVTRADALAIDTAGIEAQNVLADHIGREAVTSRAFHYRGAWLYLESRLDGASLSPQRLATIRAGPRCPIVSARLQRRVRSASVRAAGCRDVEAAGARDAWRSDAGVRRLRVGGGLHGAWPRHRPRADDSAARRRALPSGPALRDDAVRHRDHHRAHDRPSRSRDGRVDWRGRHRRRTRLERWRRFRRRAAAQPSHCRSVGEAVAPTRARCPAQRASDDDRRPRGRYAAIAMPGSAA